MKILETLIGLHLEVREGWEFMWDCFGDNAYAIDIGPRESLIVIIYDIDTQEVYSMSFVEEFDWDKPIIKYVWVNPNYRESYFNEREEKLNSYPEAIGKEIDVSEFEVIVSKHKKMCKEH